MLLTLVWTYVISTDPSCVANGNYPRAARRGEPHIVLMGVIAGVIDK
jgi:hypothetical protein